MSELILIVEDERDLVSTLDFMLRREGYRTRSAFTGRLGLELAAQSPVPQLVLLDLMLPDLPGTEVCRRLRQDERTRRMGVIMLTAKVDEIDPDRRRRRERVTRFQDQRRGPAAAGRHRSRASANCRNTSQSSAPMPCPPGRMW